MIRTQESGKVFGVFADGDVKELQCITYLEAVAIEKSMLHKRGSIWEQKHSVSGSDLRLARRMGQANNAGQTIMRHMC